MLTPGDSTHCRDGRDVVCYVSGKSGVPNASSLGHENNGYEFYPLAPGGVTIVTTSLYSLN